MVLTVTIEALPMARKRSPSHVSGPVAEVLPQQPNLIEVPPAYVIDATRLRS